MKSDRHGFRTHPLALGLALALTHALLLVHLASQRPDMGPPEPSHPHAGIDYVNADAYSRSVIAGRSFHFSDGPLLFKLLCLVDLPALLLSCLVAFAARSAGVGLYANSWVVGISWLALGTLQWFWVGTRLSAKLSRTHHGAA